MKELKNPDAEIVYLPKDLNLKELIYSFPPKVARYSNNQRRILERLAVILGQIWVRRFYRKEHQSNGFVPLNASVIQDLVKDYRPLMDWALARRIIETDNQYKGGEKSRGYRFTKNYMLETRKFFIHDPMLIAKLRGRRLDKTSINQNPEMFTYLTELQIDSKVYHELEMLREEDHQQYDMEDAEVKYFARKASIEQIEKGRFTFRKDKTVRRLHTNITNLKKEFRPYLRWKNQKLVNVDIKNSQPYFSVALLQPSTLPIQQLLNQYNPTLTTIMFSKMDEIWRTYRCDVGEYIGLVASGILYDVLGEELGMERKEAKSLIFDIFFSPPAWDFTGKDRFVKRFPSVWQVFEIINTGYYHTKKQGRRDHEQSSALALTLQRIESMVMLDHIVPRILSDLPGVPIFTIHDSIMTTEGNAKVISEIMMEECIKVMGVSPRLDFEHSSEALKESM